MRILQNVIGKVDGNKLLRANLQVLFPNISTEQKIEEFRVKGIRLFLIILLLGNILGLTFQIANQNESIITNGLLKRNSYGNGEKTETILASIEGKKQKKSIEVTLAEQQYSKREVEEIFRQVKLEMERRFLNKNKSLNEVDQSVNLVKSFKDGIVTVDWEITPFGLIDYSGKIIKKEISKQGELAKITAHLQYLSYEDYYTFYIRVYPLSSHGANTIMDRLRVKVAEKEKESRTALEIKLPLSIDNQKITWSKTNTFINLWILFLSFIIGTGLYLKGKRDLKDQVKFRENQMLLDYSNVVSKLMLLLGAGMPVSQAWSKIAIDYKHQRQEGNVQFRYIYEEMLLTYYEMSDGIPDIEAFERFGRRCKVQKYLKLSGILIQNIRQGTKEIKRLLQFEMYHAMEERKGIAKKMGEEAGTKLLGPMMLLLIVVLTIVAVPAFWAL